MPTFHKPGTIFPVYQDSPAAASGSGTARLATRRPVSPTTARDGTSKPGVVGVRKAFGTKSVGQGLSSGAGEQKALGSSRTVSASSSKPSTGTSSLLGMAKKRKPTTSTGVNVDKENVPARASSSSTSNTTHFNLGKPKSTQSATGKTSSDQKAKPTLSNNTSNRPSTFSNPKSNAIPFANASSTSAASAPLAPAIGLDEWYFTKPVLRKNKPAGGNQTMGSGIKPAEAGLGLGLATKAGSGYGLGHDVQAGTSSKLVEKAGIAQSEWTICNEKENVPPLGEPLNLAPPPPLNSSTSTSTSFLARQPLRSTYAPPQPLLSTSTFMTSTNTHTRSDSELAIAAAGWGQAPSALLPMRSSSNGRSVMQTPLKGSGRPSGTSDRETGGLGDLTGLGIGGLHSSLSMEGGRGMWVEGVSIGDIDGDVDADEQEEFLVDDDAASGTKLSSGSESGSTSVEKLELGGVSSSGGWIETEQGVWTAPPPPLTARQVQAASSLSGGGGRMRRR